MTRSEALEEMIRGHMDGLNPDSPEPGGNASSSYKHGFANGRDDRRNFPRAPAPALREAAEIAIATDMGALAR